MKNDELRRDAYARYLAVAFALPQNQAREMADDLIVIDREMAAGREVTIPQHHPGTQRRGRWTGPAQ